MFLKNLLKRTLASPAVYRVYWRGADARVGVSVLTYHAIGPDHEDFDAWVVIRRSDFETQMQYLRSNFDLLRPEDLLTDKPRREGKPKAIVTFDDGHSCLHEWLLPVLDRLQIPVTLYVSTGHIETQQPYWFDRLANALQVTSPTPLDLGAHGLGQWVAGSAKGSRHWNALSPLFEALKHLAPEQREKAVGSAVAQLSNTPGRSVQPLRPLAIEQLRRLAQSPWVTIGAHSDCHSLLDQLSLAAAEQSMQRSRELLRDWTGQPVDHFAYPNGNFTPELEAAAKRAGFRTAVTTQYGVWATTDRPYAIPRVGIGRFDGLHGMKLLMARARASHAGQERPDRQVHGIRP